MRELSSIGRVVQADPSQRVANVREHPPNESPDRVQPEAAATADRVQPDRIQPEGAPEKASSTKSTPQSFAAGGTHARLTYDVEEADVYIEILNPRTGDVIRRLPPEDAAPLLSDIVDSGPGAVINGTV